MGVVANLIYTDIGFSLQQIASFSKFWRLIATISGSIIGRILLQKYNTYNILLLGAILSAVTKFTFCRFSYYRT